MTDPIQQLRRRVDELAEYRERAARASLVPRDRRRAIAEAPLRLPNHDFWCADCQRDFTSTAWKQVRHLPHRLDTAWYVGLCPARHVCLRRITDKLADAYYTLSALVATQRRLHADDMLTPDHPRFKLVYPQKWREMQTATEHAENRNYLPL